MSLGPLGIQNQLQNQIQRRISHESPTKYDIDFYHRKITRLENDLNEVQDQLSRARIRLRRAEDYQLKYQLLLKQNSNLISDIDKRQKQYCQIKSQHQLLKVQLNDRYSKVQDFSQQKSALAKQIEKWKRKFQQKQEQLLAESNKNQQNLQKKLKKQIQSAKRDFTEKDEQNQEQIRQLRKIIHEKQTIQNVVTSKVQKVRQQKDQQIKRLCKSLDTRKADSEAVLAEKNQQIQQLRQKFEKVFNFQMENLKKNLDDQDELFNIQINGLRQLLGLKNDEISKLISQIKSQSLSHDKQRQQFIKDINNLREKIYIIERQNQIQLYNVKERLSKIHSLQIDALQKRYSQIVNNLKTQRGQLQRILKQKQKLIQAQRKDMERIKQQLLDRLKQRQARITQLQDRIKQSGDMNANEMKTLHQSFHQIQTQKQNLTNEYQNNVGFLTQQVSKLTSANQLKNKQIRQLHEQISQIKNINAQVIKDLEQRIKQERNQRQSQRERQREKRQKLIQQQLAKQRDWKYKQRELQRQRQKQQRQKNKLAYINQQLQKDIQRLNQYNKQLDQSVKRQLKKNQMSTLDMGGTRRQLTSQIQKQKSQLQSIKRMQVDQIRKKSEIEIARLTNQKQKLQTDLLHKQIAYSQLQGEFKKLEHVNRNIEKINKQKLVEYHKKMATLNSQIMLTQNLYESFMGSKAKRSNRLDQSP